MDFSKEICKKLGLNPKLQLKKEIRGLLGYTIEDLIDAIISTNNINEAAQLLGYTSNPVKQSINKVLLPIFSDRNKQFSQGGGLIPWRIVLLSSIGYKKCTDCNKIYTTNNFHSNIGRTDGLSSNCKTCAIIKSKIAKIYIKERTPNWASLENIYNIYNNCPEGYEVDHIIPLRGKLVSGLHVENNLQYLTKENNRTKSNSFSIND